MLHKELPESTEVGRFGGDEGQLFVCVGGDDDYETVVETCEAVFVVVLLLS